MINQEIEKVPQVIVLPPTPQLISLLTRIRNKSTPRSDFIFYSKIYNLIM